MKNVLTLIFALALCICLVACGSQNDPSQTGSNGAKDVLQSTEYSVDAAVERVIGLIDALGEVTLSSGKTIGNAEDAYAALSEAQKGAVVNYETLTEARAYYDRIFNVYSLIEQIGTVTKDSEAAIVAAETAYQALAIEERIAIVNAATLTAARTAFNEIPTVETLTVENVKDYFTLESTYSTSKKDFGGRYGTKITGTVAARQSVTLESLENVSITVRVNCLVGRPKDSSWNAEEEYKPESFDVTISISATNGSGSASYSTDGHYVSPYWYPSVKVESVEIISVTGTVTKK